MRILCHSVGCNPGNGPACLRCGTDLYDAEFVQYGWLEPLLRTWWRARRWVKNLGPKRCEVCKQVYVRGFDGTPTCGPDCFDRWLPF